jgi:outer membrane murein-binding lipoprotein Lpp
MTPEALSVIEKLSTMGGTAMLLFLATYYLARTLKGQYDSRITTLESRSDQCEKDRREMHNEIRAMQESAVQRQAERINILEQLLKDRAED